MENQDIDVSLVIKAFQEKIGQLSSELIIKDIVINQLQSKIFDITQKKETKEDI